MKQLNIYIIAIICVLFLTACGPGPEPEPSPSPNPPKTYSQSATLTAKGDAQKVTLNNLNSSISSVNNTANWLTATPQYYTSGHPQIELQATENTTGSERKTEVTVLASSGEKVVLTVTQEAAPAGIDDMHDEKTEKPAYSPQL